MPKLLVIDDDPAFRDGLAETLRDLGHDVAEAASGEEGLALFGAARPDLVFLDLRMPGLDGMSVLQRLRGDAAAPPVPVVVLTAYASGANTIDAMRQGAFDHLTKPLGREEVDALDRALSRSAASAAGVAAPMDGPLIGSSTAIRAVQKLVGMAAASNATVLVTGETGTGKELVARALHDHGPRAPGPFVSVNCAAIPAELLESELFGHVAGAFTGAVRTQAGRFREAQRGTLLLDEIGDMDAAMQAKILRVLQERVVTPVGGRPEAVMELERAMIRRALSETRGSRAEAARKLGINRQLLYDKIRRYGLDTGG